MTRSDVLPRTVGRGSSGGLIAGLVVLILLLLAPVLGAARDAAGQAVDPEVRQRALEAFHGPDREGKDGPLAKAGFDLTLLHYEWVHYREQGAEEAFVPSGSLPVHGERVTIDATAAQRPLALRDSLEALGLTGSAQAGPVVSGRLPIAAIPQAARLATLRAMRPARARTHDGSVTPTIRRDTSPPDSGPATDSAQASGDEALPLLYWVGGSPPGCGAAFFWLRRTP